VGDGTSRAVRHDVVLVNRDRIATSRALAAVPIRPEESLEFGGAAV
jgi:hypothetical protein